MAHSAERIEPERKELITDSKSELRVASSGLLHSLFLFTFFAVLGFWFLDLKANLFPGPFRRPLQNPQSLPTMSVIKILFLTTPVEYFFIPRGKD